MLADAVREQRGVRVHAWRGIGAGYNKFVSESFLDEVAAARGVDPLEFRLELTKDQPRAQAVIRAAAEMSNYKKKRPDRGLGIAFSDYHDTLTAGVAALWLSHHGRDAVRTESRRRGVTVQVLFKAAMQAPDVQSKLATLGLHPVGTCLDDFATHIAKQNDEYGRIIREANIKGE